MHGDIAKAEVNLNDEKKKYSVISVQVIIAQGFVACVCGARPGS